MSMNNPRVDALSSLPPLSGIEKLDQFRATLVSETLKRAVDDAGAAMAHQLNEPLTALMLYLHEIKLAGESATGTEAMPVSVREIVDLALHETERVCDIMQQAGQHIAPETYIETAVARGRDAIGFWARSGVGADNAPAPRTLPRLVRYPLTPREREVLGLITGGASNKEGGHRLGISTRTFEAHRANLMGKFGAKNAADLVRMALSESPR
jgi:DNA-binding CsgD family transcriptional regulator